MHVSTVVAKLVCLFFLFLIMFCMSEIVTIFTLSLSLFCRSRLLLSGNCYSVSGTESSIQR